ncbi:WG repeat-containing protein [Winogradskyella algicola]|uniref:WG repeat-containing protein n=1 Tax=Winogradskyella algicola TaxID=2575815 RepID=UPI001107FA88|nr:WG repeat-containing protein [Winogradskyella algicola]
MKKLIVVLVVFMMLPLTVISQDIKNIDFISPFYDGLAAIEKRGEWAFIDETGNIVVDYRNDVVLNRFGDESYPIFNSGRCLIVKKEEGISYFGFIDKVGNTIIEPQFLNATSFNNGMAIVLQLHKNVIGNNDVLDKQMIDYCYTKNVININGEAIMYLSEKPTHVTLSKDYIRVPPKIDAKFISDKLIAVKSDNNSWSIRKLESSQ